MNIIKVCYDSYDRTIEDTSDFEPEFRKTDKKTGKLFPSQKTWTSNDAWRYQNVKELEGTDHEGLLASYRYEEFF